MSSCDEAYFRQFRSDVRGPELCFHEECRTAYMSAAHRESAGAQDGSIAFLGERELSVEDVKPLCEGVPMG
jgi:hypothetical protein